MTFTLIWKKCGEPVGCCSFCDLFDLRKGGKRREYHICLEMKDYEGFQTLIANLEREFSTETIEKIYFKNVSRILKECI